MKKITLKTVLAGIILSVIPMIYGQPPGSGWTLKWMDDFNGTAVDENKWKIDDNRIRDADKNKTCYERENVSVSGGILRLKVDNKGCDCGAEYIYSGAQISSTGDFYNNKYGYIEARLRYNYTGPGFWGNFWMSSTEGWPPEFDIAECIGNEPTKMTLAYHYEDASGAKKSSGARPSCTWHDWHIYGIEWLEGQPLRFYIDGVKVFEPSVSLTYPPNEKMNVLLRMGAFNSSTWGGLPDSTTVYPGYAEYDWVKVWEKTGTGNTPPVVSLTSPLNNSTYTAPATINITATASDADGTVTKVEFYNGTVKLGEDATSPYSYTWSNVAAGTYTLTAKAYDNAGDSKSSSPVTITVADNVAETVIWYEPFTDLADGTKTDNGATAWTSSRDSGVFEVISKQFCITDAGGLGTWTSQSIDISSYSSVDVSVDLMGTGELDAGGSFMDSIRVYYIINNGTPQLLASKNGGFGNENWNTYKKTSLSGNSLKIVIKALISGGGEYYYWDNIKVTTRDVVNNAPSVGITSPSSGTSFTSPASITINATASDADGTVTKVEFYNGTVKLGEDATSPYSFTWSNVSEGMYTLIARAIDNSGASKSVSILVYVNPPSGTNEIWLETFSGLPDSTRTDSGTTTWNSSRPSGVFCVMGEEFCITNAGGEGVWTSQNINISGYASVTLSVDLQGMGQLDASGPNLDYIKVYYVIDGGAETLLYGQNGGWSDELKHTYTKTGLSGNTMKIVIRALTTGGGEYYYWDNIKVTAGEKINQPPVVSLQSPLNNASYVAPAAITLSATATDADGSIVVVEFYAGDTKIGEDNTAPYAFTWTSVQEGNYMLSARAIDNNGAIASSSQVLIKVNANVSVEEFFEDIYVYPTYTTGLLYVLNASGHLYSVVSLPGTVVMTGKIEGEKIDVSTLPEGMYLLHITGNRGVYVARINKQ